MRALMVLASILLLCFALGSMCYTITMASQASNLALASADSSIRQGMASVQGLVTVDIRPAGPQSTPADGLTPQERLTGIENEP